MKEKTMSENKTRIKKGTIIKESEKPTYVYNGETPEKLYELLVEINNSTYEFTEEPKISDKEIGYILLTDKQSIDTFLWKFASFYFCGWRAKVVIENAK